MIRIRLLLLAFLSAGACGSAFGASYLLPPDGVDVIGEVSRVRATYDDTFVGFARRYDVGYEELVRANPGVDPWLPGEGTEVIIPTRFVLPDAPRNGIVLNLSEMRLYYYPPAPKGEQRVVMTFPIGVGSVSDPDPTLALDEGIVRTVWLTADEIRAQPERLRSPLVLECIEAYLAGHRYPLGIVNAHDSLFSAPASPAIPPSTPPVRVA